MNGITAVVRGIIPTQVQVEVGSVVAMMGTAFNYLCGWDKPLEVLLWLMVLDYVSGVLSAYINPNLALNSHKGFNGILKKVMILVLVCLAHMVDSATGQVLAQSIVVWFFIGNEGLSIVENASKAGLPVPEKLKNTLEQLRDQRESMEKKK